MKKWIFTFLLAGLSGIVFSQASHTITIDGTNDFTSAYEQMQTTSGTTLYAYVTWDVNNIYIGISGSSPAGSVTDNNRVYHIYIDTDPQTTLTSGNGTTDGETWRWDPTLPFNADYHYAFKTVDNSEYKRSYSGGSWNDATIGTSNWKGSGYWELSISRSDIGSPSAIYLVVYVEEDWSGGSICGGLPSGLFTNTSTSGSITFNDYWKGYELTSGITPNDGNYDNRRFVSGNETISSNTTWEGLTILPGGMLTVNTGNTFTLNNDIKITSNANGTGSLLVNGTLSVTGTSTIQRYLTTYTNDNDGWHLLSSPVTSFTISGSDFEPIAGTDDLYIFDQSLSSNYWINYDQGSITTFDLGKGYLVAYSGSTASNPKTFTGTINVGDQSPVNLAYTSTSSNAGWNLIGNPYTSAIDWDLITKSGSVDNTVYVLNSTNGSYESYNSSTHTGTGTFNDGIIPAMQGFFVKATATSQTVTFKKNAQVNSNRDFYKSVNEENKTLRFVLSNNQYSNEGIVLFRDDASLNFDSKYDGYKLFGLGTTPEIFTKVNDTFYSINCLPSTLYNYDLPLGVNIQKPGEYKISFTGFNSFTNNLDVTLEDLKNEQTIKLNEGSQYTFTYSDGDDQMRFILHFYGINGISNIKKENHSVLIFASENIITVKSLKQKLNGTLEVVNMLGQTVYSEPVSGRDFVSIRPETERGVYIVRFVHKNGTVESNKIVLQ